MKRTIAIGDTHGCLGLLERLLDKINYDPAADTLVSVGDLIDRGPHSAGVVRLLRKLQANGKVIVIKGNHDDKCVRWFRREAQARETGKPNKMNPPKPARLAQWQELTAEEIQWLDALPLFVKVLPDWYAVHAGFEDLPMDKQEADHVIRVRWLNAVTGKHKPLDKDSNNPFDKPIDAVYWMERWKGPENVVYGHAVHSRATPRVDRPVSGVETWGIDTGACYGGNLSALCLETREVFQVRDGAAYDVLHVTLADGS